MPTYEYACKSCGQHLEVVQSFSDDPLTECPSCQGPLRKVFGSIGITFKGSGFYKTDSRSGGGKSGESGKSDAGKTDAPKSDAAKSDTAKSDSGKSSSGDSAPKAAAS